MIEVDGGVKMKRSELDRLLMRCGEGVIREKFERNEYLFVSYCGVVGGLVSEKWNVKIYKSGSVVCNDMYVLKQLLSEEGVKKPDESKKLLKIDDSGWGFPALGVMVGVCDGVRIETDMVDVRFFKQGIFDRQEYLKEYSRLGREIVKNKFHASFDTHRIEICTGYVNRGLRDDLRVEGYDVRVVEIVGMLQDGLEKLFKQEVKRQLGLDLGYDPKGMKRGQISKKYYKVLEEVRRLRPDMLKSGWGSLRVSEKSSVQQMSLF